MLPQESLRALLLMRFFLVLEKQSEASLSLDSLFTNGRI